MLLVATLSIALLGGLVVRGMSAPLAGILEKAGEIVIAEKEVGTLLAEVVRELGVVFVWPAFAIVFVALFSSLVQIGPLFAPKRMQPKLNKISPLA